MRKILTLPTWVLTLILKPFLPKEHPFKSKITLDDWSKNSTKLNDAISLYYWLQIPVFTIFILFLLNKK